MKTDIEMIRLGMNDIEWATDLMVEVFLNEPPFTQIFQGLRRETQVRYFMRSTCTYALLFGECYTTPAREGVALWLTPGKTAMTLGRMYRAGMLIAPFRMGLSAFGRFRGFAQLTDDLHKKSAPMPHYYLFMLGVSPTVQGKGIGGHLLESMLGRIDREQMPAYLETQNERNVGFYRRCGFEVAAEEPFPNLEGVRNWGMLRKEGGL